MNATHITDLSTGKGIITISQEHISAKDYIEFLTRTDLGKQYPKERFNQRIEKLVNNTQLSLIARTDSNKIVGICFGLTDYAYWLLLTDIGIDREYIKNGIGKSMITIAREQAGGKDNIIVFIYANEDAVGFYKKCGLTQSQNMMELTNIEWTSFEVGKDK
ncbi:GNAT family N-acetyltransferase [Gracilinema caldarium]|uniref:GCN5-related N-acetyltransferase n=1 Tax=Gracilinema caldarium (strain ATCC 51460 / DSM 7334 / H1) TaxID=744872 RepID=F8F309_GRAC1|nr:GNAT family N-acetyltransferase [Gracilinema caldarium]AEJ19917.1 GCN5-related N-acetyltransferase [Gracilinema caldarium DSM 7334]